MSEKINSNKIFVISGSSGVGKGTVIREVLKQEPRCSVSVSHSTRPPRTGEVNGHDYYFVSVPEFKELIARGDFIEHAQVHGNYYGTSQEMLTKLTGAGKWIIFEVDVQGGLALKEKLPELTAIFLLPPSQETLLARIKERGTEDEQSVLTRLATMKKELPAASRYDYQLVNDNLDETVAAVLKIIRGE